jgi:hypothetical protein
VLLTWASSEPAKVIAIVGGFVILLALSIITTNEGLLSLDFVLSIVGIFAGLVILIPKKRRSLGKNLTLASLASVVLTLFAKTFSTPSPVLGHPAEAIARSEAAMEDVLVVHTRRDTDYPLVCGRTSATARRNMPVDLDEAGTPGPLRLLMSATAPPTSS